ncbi:MAG TPA: ABC transporter ATP-binding protein [Fibrobacteria bacterium]|nr:ABC transporter ATP-binding protein [Fibrobacteria bacterium]
MTADPRGAGPLLAARGLSVGYRAPGGAARAVAAGLDVELHRGELVCLLGPNGAGKSTLLRTLAGLQPPLAGEILWEGSAHAATARERARRIAIVLTERVLGGNLTVYDLAALGRHPHTGWAGRLGPADRAAVTESLRAAGAWDLRARLVDELSDGERQKAMLARALAQEPALLLLDEPTAFLDLPRRVEAMRLLRRLARESGRAVLLSTHDLDLALRAADRLWLLPPGGPLRAGLPEDLALGGDVGEVFDQGDVVFDRDTGEFRVHGHPVAAADVSGEASLRLWAARALEREGYASSGIPGSVPALRVEAVRRRGAPAWILTDPSGAVGEFVSLSDLVRAVRRLPLPPSA